LQQVLLDVAIESCKCKFIKAKAIGVNKEETAVVLEGKSETVPFDVLIIADGAHSIMRENLGIKAVNVSGSGCGVVATLTNPTEQPMTLFAKLQNGWLLRIFATFDALYVAVGCGDVSVETFKNKMSSNWVRTVTVARLLRGVVSGDPVPFEDKPFPLVHFSVCRAEKFLHTFKSGKKCLIIGDAAHTTSFFSGSGANYGVKSIPAVVDYVKEMDDEKFEKANEDLFHELVSKASGFVPYLEDTRTRKE